MNMIMIMIMMIIIVMLIDIIQTFIGMQANGYNLTMCLGTLE
jgi:hypothetical protein